MILGQYSNGWIVLSRKGASWCSHGVIVCSHGVIGGNEVPTLYKETRMCGRCG